MPYRRLPNTDQARLRALKTAVQRAAESDFTEQVLPYRLSMEAEACLLKLENIVSQYKMYYDNKTSSNKKYRTLVQNTRMYISHFIQVLNLAVIRGEIKKEAKKLYHLEEDVFVLPDLSNEENLLLWGKNIIEGETARMAQGGIPINFPAINKVKAHYDIFSDSQSGQSMNKLTAERVTEEVQKLRVEADAIIVKIWDIVEKYYEKRLPYDRMCRCKEYGLIFYYRPDEKRFSAETDKALEKAAASQMKLELL